MNITDEIYGFLSISEFLGTALYKEVLKALSHVAFCFHNEDLVHQMNSRFGPESNVSSEHDYEGLLLIYRANLKSNSRLQDSKDLEL